jgi:hypothetical protein
MSNSEPIGPLAGDELERAKDKLTPKQFQAYKTYRQYRGQHAHTWIARRVGVSPKGLRTLVAKAQKHLGYESSFAPKQKAKYKPVAERRVEPDHPLLTWLLGIIDVSVLEDTDYMYVRREYLQAVNGDADAEASLRRRAVRLKRRYHSADDQMHEASEWDDLSADARRRGEDLYGQEVEEQIGARPEQLIEDDLKGGYDRD